MTYFSADKAFAEKKHEPRIYSFSLVLLQCLLLALYRIVLPVLILQSIVYISEHQHNFNPKSYSA